MAAWKIIVCNRDGSDPAEILNADNRQFVPYPLLKVPTAAFRVRLDHPLANRLLYDDVYIKTYRNNTLNFVGPTLTAEEAVSDGEETVQVNCVGSFWYLSKRLLGKSAAGWNYGDGSNLKNRADCTAQILNTINAEEYTGISLGTVDSLPVDSYLGPVRFYPAGQGIMEISAALNSCEWQVVPTEPTTIGGTSIKKIGSMNILARIGTYRPNAVFEFGGGGRQITSFKHSISREGQVTYGYTLPDGFPAGTTGAINFGATGAETEISGSSDTASAAARGRTEEVIPSDVTAFAVRKALGNAHVAIRKKPRQLITFTLAANAKPEPFVDYTVGDSVRARATYNGITRFDAQFRVWNIIANLDPAGNEIIELELSNSDG